MQILLLCKASVPPHSTFVMHWCWQANASPVATVAQTGQFVCMCRDYIFTVWQLYNRQCERVCVHHSRMVDQVVVPSESETEVCGRPAWLNRAQ